MKHFIYFTFFSLMSQWTLGQTIYDNGTHQLYQAIATITDTDDHMNGEGYIVSSTAIESTETWGEVLRLDPSGNMIWNISLTHLFQPISDAQCRITHIEKYNATGQMEFLVVGSMNYPGYSTLVVAILDDNGDVLQSMEYNSNYYDYLIGVKGIYANGEFVLIGVDAQGFANTDDKDILVMGLDVSSLSINWQHELTSGGSAYDYDMVTDIISITGTDDVFITGTTNTTSTSSPNSTEAVMCARINSNGIVWNNNYTTQNNSWDAGACALYNPNSNSIYVLGNNALNHAFHITEFDASTGTQLNAVYGQDYMGQYDKFGFEMRFTDNSTDNIIVSGYEFQYLASGGSSGDTYVFLCEFDANLTAINQINSYAANNSLSSSSGIYNYNENALLYLTPHEFPYYYNNMMSKRYDDDGYVMVGNSNANDPIAYGKKIWSVSNNIWTPDGSTPVCDLLYTEYGLDPGSRNYTSLLSITGITVQEDGPVLQYDYIDIHSTECAPFLKKESITSIAEQSKLDDVAYPNPMINTLQINPTNGATHFSIYDLIGKVLITGQLNSTGNHNVNVEDLNSGNYLLILTKDQQQVYQQLIQKVK